jgi:hypothetical protein
MHVDDGDEVRDVVVTGGSPAGVPDRTHGISFQPASASVGGFVAHGLSVRHHGDDCVLVVEELEAVVERLRCEWASAEAGSAQMLDFGPNSPTNGVDVTDALCVDCTDGAGLIYTGTSQNVTLTGIARWGERAAFESVDDRGMVVSDLLSVGGDGRLPLHVDGFVVALADDRDAEVFNLRTLIDRNHVNVSNGIIRDVTRAGSRIVLVPDDASISNVAIVDVDTSDDCSGAPCTILDLASQISTTSIHDVTIGFRPGTVTRFASGMRASNSSDLDVEGLLIAGLVQSETGGLGIEGSFQQIQQTLAASSSGPCLHEVGTLVSEPGALPPSAVELVGPIFVDPSATRFDAIPGGPADLAGCGVLGDDAAPGLHTFRWMHAVTRTEPEVMADSPADPDPCEPDQDGDLVADCDDVCPEVFDPDQDDADGDGAGDACEAACSDGLDNDGDGDIDWNGGPGGEDPDPICDHPDQGREAPRRCGLGAELAIGAAALGWIAARRRWRG